jgi:tetratricopeptide (TPR) repeat protein
MFCLTVEITGFKQLHRLVPNLMREIQRALDTLLEVKNAKQYSPEDGLFFFFFDNTRPSDYIEVAEVSYDLFESLQEYKKELMGYLLLLDVVDDAAPEQLARKARNEMRKILVNDTFIIGKNASALFSSVFDLEQKGNHFQVGARNRKSLSRIGDIEEFSWREKSIEIILDALSVYLNREEEPGILFLYGVLLNGNRYAVEAALQKLIGESKEKQWISIYPGSYDAFPCDELCHSLYPEFMQETEHFLTLTEKAVWKSKFTLLNSFIDTSGSIARPYLSLSDFYIGYSLYLTAYIRRMNEALLPAVLFCDDIQLYNQGTRTVLHDLFESLLRFDNFFPVVLSSKPYVPGEFRALPYRKIKIPQLDTAEIEQRMSGYFDRQNMSEIDPEKMNRAVRGRVVALFHLLHSQELDITNRELEKIEEKNKENIFFPTICAMRELDEYFREILYVCSLSSGIFDRSALLQFFEAADIVNHNISNVLNNLISLGFIRDEKKFQFLYPELQTHLEKVLGERAGELQAKLVNFFYTQWKEHRIALVRSVLTVFEKYACFDVALEAYHEYIHDLIVRGDRASAYEYTHNRIPFYKEQLKGKDLKKLNAVLYLLRLRLALSSRDAEGADRIFASFQKQQVSSSGVIDKQYEGAVQLQHGRYHAAAGDMKAALTSIKRAIIIFQNSDDSEGITSAYTEMGLHALFREHIGDGREYFVIAQKAIDQKNQGAEYIKACIFEAVTLFVTGNYSRVLSIFDKTYNKIVFLQMHDMLLFVDFMRGRVLFELGLYSECVEHLQRSLNNCDLRSHKESAVIVRRWIARGLLYQDAYKESFKILEDMEKEQEVLFFLSELHYRNGSREKALETLDRAAALQEEQGLFTSDRINWHDGFSGAEGLCIGNGDGQSVLFHLISAFRAYLLAETDKISDGIDLMHNMTRETKVSKHDPYNSFYHLLYSLILPRLADDEVEDKLTILGKAVRFLRERSSRIDNSSHKANFLYSNYWNNQLIEEAKKYNLF